MQGGAGLSNLTQGRSRQCRAAQGRSRAGGRSSKHWQDKAPHVRIYRVACWRACVCGFARVSVCVHACLRAYVRACKRACVRPCLLACAH
eukprot:4700855-Alexandrium_andersonii.AAC.1